MVRCRQPTLTFFSVTSRTGHALWHFRPLLIGNGRARERGSARGGPSAYPATAATDAGVRGPAGPRGPAPTRPVREVQLPGIVTLQKAPSLSPQRDPSPVALERRSGFLSCCSCYLDPFCRGSPVGPRGAGPRARRGARAPSGAFRRDPQTGPPTALTCPQLCDLTVITPGRAGHRGIRDMV